MKKCLKHSVPLNTTFDYSGFKTMNQLNKSRFFWCQKCLKNQMYQKNKKKAEEPKMTENIFI